MQDDEDHMDTRTTFREKGLLIKVLNNAINDEATHDNYRCNN